MLIDSNIIIYASKPEYPDLRTFIATHTPDVSAISAVKVLGYHLLTDEERHDLEAFFQVAPVIDLSFPVLYRAIQLRQQRKMTVGDALVAGTALLYNLTLVTHNTKHFIWIPDLRLFDPLTSPTAP